MRRRSQKRPPRVLLLLPGAFGLLGGIEMFNRILIKAFHASIAARGGRCEALVLLDAEGAVDPRYVDARQPAPRGFEGSRARFSAAAVGELARSRPDLIVFGHVNFGPLGLVLRAAWPFAEQWTVVHGVEVWTRLELARRLAVQRAERVLSVSEYTRRELVARNDVRPERVGLLPDALDPYWQLASSVAAEPTTRAAAAPVLLTVGRLAASERMKGVDQVIVALPAIARAVPGVRYVVVGDGTDRPRLEELARTTGVADRVEFRGRVSSDELARAYAGASLFAMPSAQEGFGIVYLEAGAFGVPSIAGAHGACPEVVLEGETGRCVKHGDAAAFAAAAIELLSNPAELRAMGARARARVLERFSYAAFAARLEQHVARSLDPPSTGDALEPPSRPT